MHYGPICMHLYLCKASNQCMLHYGIMYTSSARRHMFEGDSLVLSRASVVCCIYCQLTSRAGTYFTFFVIGPREI